MPATVSSRAAELTTDLTATSGETAAVIAPFTGEVLHELPISSAQDVADAAAAARVAQAAWRATSPAHRRAVLLKAHDLLLERRGELLDLLQTESGKTRGQAFEEVFQAASVTRYSALSAARVLRTHGRRSAIPLVLRAKVSYRPKGLIAIVTPWNYPISLAAMDVVPALATGNAVLQKADNQGALSILATRRAFIDAGVPAALWAVVAGPGAVVGNAVVDAGDYVAFTGSTPTGLGVGARAIGKLHGASLELGGKNPMIVLDDVDPVKTAADAAYAAFSSMGQLCVSIERIYVERGVAEAFTTAFAERVAGLKQGSALDYSTDVGSLTSAAQLERVQAHVDDAVAKGATVLAGGVARPELGPFFYAPTVLSGVTEQMECFAGETFGPVVSIYVVDNEDEAIAAANDSEFGLNASVFSGSRARARRVAARLEAGSVNINEGYRASFGTVAAPMGGLKMSGLGRRNGPEGMLRYVDSTTIAEATGLIGLPRVGPEFERLSGVLVTLLKALKAIRRR
ncbi:succinic semialdehyde dehydrogenase [Leifsonia sp. H3M29-4]|uniref:succinic semialdehyde dehydrogenase n=1 Tax=Salinibacterium metalliresistens TaxID=3031321 RepID=UPI0023DC7868|nr:succinic semialdehyde dehydrogenase [Salinibacterium metalliresistens]MDF1479523.1 succinic semialdehyde dehydrogenase [Salinibacterium metalliresistens]